MPDYQDPPLEFDQTRAFLHALGKNGDTRLRTFPHKNTPPEVKARLGARKFSKQEHEALIKAHREGRGVYVVINDGGDKKETITRCRAYFAEFDGIDEQQQLEAVNTSGLPEASIIVRTGGGSLHFYWVLSEPTSDTAIWQQDMKRLAAHLSSDPSVNDPSRVMRLPGFWYMNERQEPVALVEIVHDSGLRYTRDDIVQHLPELPQYQPPAPAQQPDHVNQRGITVPLTDFISKGSLQLVQQGSAPGSNNEDGLQLPLDLIGTEQWLHEHGIKPAPTARELYEQYTHASAAHFGPSYDHAVAWRRFEGAYAKNPTPSTPPDKLFERLAYHSRQQNKPTGGSPGDVFTAEPARTASTKPSTSRSWPPDDDDDDLDDDSGLSLSEQLDLSERLAEGRRLFTLDTLLPHDLAAAVERIHQPLPTDPLTAALTVISGYSGVLKLGTFISSSASHKVPANLFLALVAKSGLAKTSVKRALIDDPAHDIRRAAAQAHNRAIQDWEEQNRGVKKADRTPPPRPVFPHLSDYTPAALSVQLQLNESRGLGQLITVDELSGLLGAIEQDTKGGSGTANAQLLEAFDGSGFTSIRIERGACSYERCHVSLYGNVQPDVLTELVNGQDSTGKFARFLFCRVPNKALQLDDHDPTPEAFHALEQAQQVLRTYASTLYALPPRTYCLSQPARARFHAWFRNHQDRALATATPGVISALLGKTSAHALRLAGLLHLPHLIAGNRQANDTIPVDTIDVAMAIVDQLVAETEAFYDAPETTTDTAVLARYIHHLSWTSGKAITCQDARDKGGRPIRRICKAQTFVPAIEELQRLGYGSVEDQGPAISGKAKPVAYRASREMA